MLLKKNLSTAVIKFGYPIKEKNIDKTSYSINKGKKRNQITELNISQKNLTGPLKLVGFSNLRELNCSENQITSLDLSDCKKLEKLNCQNNQLSQIKLPQGEKLER